MKWVAGVALAVVVALTGLTMSRYSAGNDLFDRMIERSAAVQALNLEQGWNLESLDERKYRPWCIDVRCPSIHAIYIAEVPENEPINVLLEPMVELLLEPLTPTETDKLSGLGEGQWSQTKDPCLPTDDCSVRARAERFDLLITTNGPLVPLVSNREARPGMQYVAIQVGLT